MSASKGVVSNLQRKSLQVSGAVFVSLCYDASKSKTDWPKHWEASMNFKVVSLTVIAIAGFTASALAHHSFAMFDRETTLTLEGSVKQFEWVSPHAWLRVNVNDEQTGKPVLWLFELSSPTRLVTMGLRADSMKPGDIVTVTFHPMKDGTRAGQFIQAVLADGKKVLRANARNEND
jgi:Family of unknown function (DUF6152)